MAVIQFLLGVDAPVSLLLLQQIFLTVLVNTLIALPVYEIVRRLALPALPARPAPAPSPRLHDRRRSARCSGRPSGSAAAREGPDDR